MKNTIFLLLIIPVIAFSQPNDQTSKSSQPVKHQDSLVYSRISSQIGEMEIDFIAAFQLKKAEVLPSLLDSTRIYQFNSLKDSVLVDRTLLTYNSTGVLKNKSNYIWNDYYKKMLKNNYEYLYNKTGKLTTVMFNDWRFSHHDIPDNFSYKGIKHSEGTDLVNYLSKYLYTYDRSGHQTTFSYKIYDENSQYWNVWAETQDFYDAAGIRVSEIAESHYEFIHKEEFSYDYNKNLSGITQYNRTNVYTWFYSGKIKYEYIYDSESRVTSLLSSYWSFSAGQWKSVFKVDYSYHANGDLASRIYSIIDTLRNEMILANKTDYKYNEIDKINLREDYAWNKTASQWELRKKQFYYYTISDPTVNLNELSLNRNMPFRVFPNPAKDMLWIENTDNFALPFQICNVNGRCVKTAVIGTGLNNISLNQLPKGIYFITIPDRNELKSCKLIIE